MRYTRANFQTEKQQPNIHQELICSVESIPRSGQEPVEKYANGKRGAKLRKYEPNTSIQWLECLPFLPHNKTLCRKVSIAIWIRGEFYRNYGRFTLFEGSRILNLVANKHCCRSRDEIVLKGD